MPNKIFINYRREDTRWTATSLYTQLLTQFTRERLFMDVSAIPLGVDFAEYLGNQVSKCRIMISLIGHQWLDVLLSRLHDADDFVRIEIATALEHNIRIIPVLIDGAMMPKAEELPARLKPLARRNTALLRHDSFGSDADKLARVLQELMPSSEPDVMSRPSILPQVPLTSNDTKSEEKPGKVFKDTAFGPEMVVVPAGHFLMGSRDDEGESNEHPQHPITFETPFAVGKYPVTFDEWDAFFAMGGTDHCPGDEGWGRKRKPVVNVSWNDAKAYAAWIADATGLPYRLLSEAEWEYCCRAGTTTPYSTGESITRKHAWFEAGETAEVGKYPPNAYGLCDMHGNVFEWVEDCYHSSYVNKPLILRLNGCAWITTDCTARVIRGGAWGICRGLRSANRATFQATSRFFHVGFRVARTL